MIVLSPAAPHISEELFNIISNTQETIFDQKIPDFDEAILQNQEKIIGIQINGKVRAEIAVSESESEEILKEKILEMPEIKKWTEDKEIRKFIYIPGRIISIVL